MERWGRRTAAPRRRAAKPSISCRLGRLLRRRRRWIVFPTLACAAAALVAVTTISPRYTGVAKVLLENQESYFTRPDKAIDRSRAPIFDPEGVQSQAETVTTTELARKAVDQLQLGATGRVQSARSTNPAAIVWSLLSRRPRRQAGGPACRRVPVAAHRFPDRQIARVADRVLEPDPALAARGANTVAELYLDAQQQAKRDEAKAASAWLSTKIDELRGKVAEADARSKRFAPVPVCSPAPTA